MKLMIQIDSENDACRTREDILSILDDVSDRLRLAGTCSKHNILDRNGNYVGWYSISADDPQDDSCEDEDNVSEDNDEEDNVSEDNDDEDSNVLTWDECFLIQNDTYRKFAVQCKEAGYEVQWYRGRGFYEGPSVTVDTWDDVLKVCHVVTMQVKTDNMGLGHVVYPY